MCKRENLWISAFLGFGLDWKGSLSKYHYKGGSEDISDLAESKNQHETCESLFWDFQPDFHIKAVQAFQLSFG